MSLTIDSILNFNSCEVENRFFEPPVSNPNGVNLHPDRSLAILATRSSFKLHRSKFTLRFTLRRARGITSFKPQLSKFKFHRPWRATSKCRISNLYDRKSLQPLNLTFLKRPAHHSQRCFFIRARSPLNYTPSASSSSR